MAKEGANPTCSSSKWNGGGGSSIQPSGLATRVGTLAGERRSPASESGEEDDSEDSDCSSSMGQNSDVSGSGSSEEDCRETSFRARTRDLRMPWTRWSRVQIANKYLCENKGSRSILVGFSIVSLYMAASNIFGPVSQEEFNAFHTIDRNLYSILVMKLWRDPVHSMQVLALWIWLERVGYYNTVKNILSLPQFLIYELADEAITCLSCFNNLFVCLSEDMDIPLMRCLMEKDISLAYFLENRLVAAQGVTKVYNDVCIRALTDIMHQAIQRNHAQISMDSQMGDGQNMSPSSQQSLAQPVAPNEIVFGDVQKYARERQLSEDDRTMFVTFSKGYPVQEQEVREFLINNYGDCIESFYMQEVGLNEQSLYARVIFRATGIMDQILGGRARAKFSINGKHVWLRKYVRNHPRPLVPMVQGMPSFPFPYAP